MAFDFGMKKIGVAIGQPITRSANRLTVLTARDGVPDWQKLQQLVDAWQPSHLVVGLPLNMDGTGSEMSHLATKFGRRLSGRFNIPHSTLDERLSSFEARLLAKDKRPYDDIAAKLILETYFRQLI